MGQKLAGSAVVLSATYNYASSPAAGGTDVTADSAGIIHGPLYVGEFGELDIDVAVTFVGGTSPSVNLHVGRFTAAESGGVATKQGPTLLTVTSVTSGVDSPLDVGYGSFNGSTISYGFGRFVRVFWDTIGGAPTGMTLVVSIIGKSAS